MTATLPSYLHLGAPVTRVHQVTMIGVRRSGSSSCQSHTPRSLEALKWYDGQWGLSDTVAGWMFRVPVTVVKAGLVKEGSSGGR